MAFEQLDLFPDPVLDEIYNFIIKTGSDDVALFLDLNLSKKFKIKNSQSENIKNKLKFLIYNKIKNDLSQNLIDYLLIQRDHVLSRNLLGYINKDYRYVINYSNFASYINEDKLSDHFEDYDTGDIVQAFDVIEDKVVNFKVTRVVLERID